MIFTRSRDLSCCSFAVPVAPLEVPNGFDDIRLQSVDCSLAEAFDLSLAAAMPWLHSLQTEGLKFRKRVESWVASAEREVPEATMFVRFYFFVAARVISATNSSAVQVFPTKSF